MKHHICIYDDYTTCDKVTIPFGSILIEKHLTEVLGDMFDTMVPLLHDGEVYVCGEGDARRVLGRKLEDRLQRAVVYE